MTSPTLRKILIAVGAIAALSVAACGHKSNTVTSTNVDNTVTVPDNGVANQPTSSGKLQ